MKVVYVYRKAQPGQYSIEELFHNIADELRNKLDVVEYRIRGRASVLVDGWRLRRFSADIYHVTGDINYLVNILPRQKTVLTVHDIGHFLFGLRGVKRWLYKWFWLILPIRRAAAVTSVSFETRRNIRKHLGIANRCIDVIQNCYNPLFKPVTKPFVAECPVILQIGTKPYKNVPRLVKALEGLSCRLILVGRLDDETMQRLTESNIEYENYVDLTHGEIHRLYIQSDIVAFVSLGEGFGVPIVEAQAIGRPVITANLPPMSDVAGEGACLVNPLDFTEIREGVLRIMTDEAYRKRLVKLGFYNVSRYSPAAVSSQYFALYNTLILP